ncbi:MAG: translation initiation factor IF-3 [Candidatus Kapaibacterium sp.]
MNERIRVPEIRVIDEEGNQLGLMTPRDAMQIAQERELDLVEIAPNAKPPVCKIIDYGKYRYEQQKRDKAQRKTQHQQQLKEVRLHPRTDTHDLDFKKRHAREWLEEGNKVKFSVFFKGREMAHKDIGRDLLEAIIQDMTDVAKVDQAVRMDGRNMHMTLAPDKKK